MHNKSHTITLSVIIAMMLTVRKYTFIYLPQLSFHW